jgi:hypothetical protein
MSGAVKVNKAGGELRLRSSEIEATDLDAVIGLLATGFRRRTPDFWRRVLEQLGNRQRVPGLPKYGYALHANEELVGAILLISTPITSAGKISVRCNLSAWYVDPQFKPYAAVFVSRVLAKHRDVTFINVSPAFNTLKTIEAQGFSAFSKGQFFAVPILSKGSATRVQVRSYGGVLGALLSSDEHHLLRTHSAFGCLCLCCISNNEVVPFVFLPRTVKRILPCAQLIYCRTIEDVVRFARPLGKYLAARGQPIVMMDACGEIRGLWGTYVQGYMPKYFKGDTPPRLGDLSFTETAMFGI